MPSQWAGLRHFFQGAADFVRSVLSEFKRNQGLLLAGACAYYTLLSILPLFTLLLIALSHFVEEEQLLHTVTAHTELLVPDFAPTLKEQFRQFLEYRKVVGGVVFLVMLFFSSLAFTALENAMSVIFFHRVRIHRRHFLVSAVIPYLFILSLGIGVFFVTLMSGALQALDTKTISIFGSLWSLDGAAGILLHLIGLSGLILMLTAFYLVMPVGRISFRHALIGGIIAGMLWEVIRHALIWYFHTLSFVDVIYGSLATAIVALVSLEFAAIILLLGAQVIAELERGRKEFVSGEPPGLKT